MSDEARTRARRDRRYTKADRDLVLKMRAERASKGAIARALGITVRTLNKYFGFELLVGHVKFKADCSVKICERAMKGNVSALKFILERKFGWTLEAAKQKQTPPGRVITVSEMHALGIPPFRCTLAMGHNAEEIRRETEAHNDRVMELLQKHNIRDVVAD